MSRAADGAAARLALQLPDAESTIAMGQALAPTLRPGDAALLSGGLGAGKSTFARAVIQSRLAAEGRHEDAPSPTYTLMQVYETINGALRHADLYRLSGPEEAEELGLFEDAERAILLIEWPDRLGDATPERRLELHFEIDRVSGGAPEQAGRRLDVAFIGPAWEASDAAMRDAAASAARTETGGGR